MISKKVLIINDKDDDFFILENLLNKLFDNIKIIKADIEKSSITSIIEKAPDLILVDLDISEISAYELCEKIKKIENSPFIPVIFLTDKNLKLADIKKGYESGCDDFITKPFEPTMIFTRIKNALNLKRITNTQKEQSFGESSKEINGVEAERYLNVAAEIILSIDKNGTITLLNESGHQLLGYKQGELVGKDWFDNCLPTEDIDEVRNVFNQIMHDQIENVVNYESKIRTKTGEIKTILWHNTVFRNENGEISGTLSSGEDITERKISEKKLRESEAKLRSYIENAPDGIFIANEKGEYVEANKAACQITGYPEEEILKLTIPDLLQPHYVAKGIAGFQKLSEEGSVKTELGYVTKSGENRFWQVSAVKLSETRYMGFVKDITEKKQIEEKLVEAKNRAEDSEEKFSTIFNMSSSMICVADINTATFKFINPAFKKILGYDENELLAKPFLDFIHPDDLQPTIDIIEEKLKIDKSVIYFENRYKRKDGSYCHLAWNSFPVSKKGITYAIAIDITDQKKAKLELQKKQNELDVLIKNAPICIKKVDLDFNLQFMSEAGIKELKVGNVHNFYNTPYPFHFFPESFKKEMRNKLEVVKKTGQKIQIDGLLSDMQGKEMWYTHILVPVKNQEAEIDYILVLSMNITDRKKAELELEEKFNHLRRINLAMSGRENRMIELKEKINELSIKCGEKPPYKLDFL